MKKLLSVIAVLLLAITLVPVQSFAGARGSITPITQGSDLTDGGHSTVALRPFPAYPSGDKLEFWMALTSRNTDEGFQTIRTIYQFKNATVDPAGLGAMGAAVPNIQAPFLFAIPDPWSADHVRLPLLTDPLRIDSYTDPAWSPNGQFLAYVKTDKFVSSSAIFVQEFALDTADPENEITHTTKIGSPIAVTDGFAGDGHQNRHPSWSPDGNSLTFDSDRTGLSNDIYTQVVFPSVAASVRQTTDDVHSEEDPDWSPTPGNRIVFSSNLFGPFTLLLKDLVGGGITSAETSFANVSHRRPSWSSDGNSIYYDAPQAEDADNNLAVWKLDLDTQQKCEIALDINSNFDVDASSKLVTRTVPNFNFIIFTADAQGAFGFGGQHIWRSNYVQNCLPPLPIGVSISPTSVSTCNSAGADVNLNLSMSDEVRALGFACSNVNLPSGEGLRVATSGRNPSPQINGLTLGAADIDPHTGAARISGQTGNGASMTLKINRRRMVNRLLALGFSGTGNLVPVQFNAYSRNSGRKFQGFGYVRLESCGGGAAALSLSQNSPNPFNPQTTIKFATSRDGVVSVKVFNVHGSLVRTLTNQWYPQGEHEVQWNGKSDRGTSVSSGIYYAKAFGPAGAQDQIKMVMMK